MGTLISVSHQLLDESLVDHQQREQASGSGSSRSEDVLISIFMPAYRLFFVLHSHSVHAPEQLLQGMLLYPRQRRSFEPPGWRDIQESQEEANLHCAEWGMREDEERHPAIVKMKKH